MRKLFPLITIILALTGSGCIVIRHDQILSEKSTVFGLDIAVDGDKPHIRFGLVRYFCQEVPVSSNAIYAPYYSTSTQADIGLTHQTVDEQFQFGKTNAP